MTFLAERSVEVSGQDAGHTLVTAVKSETTDDEPPAAASRAYGRDIPLLAKEAEASDGRVVGYSIITRQSGETTDDPGY